MLRCICWHMHCKSEERSTFVTLFVFKVSLTKEKKIILSRILTIPDTCIGEEGNVQ